MHILQAAIAVVGRHEAEVGSHGFAPGLRQIFDLQAALQHSQLQVEPQHDVKIVSHLVGIGADQRSLDLVDGAIERVERDLRELVRKRPMQQRIIALPEGAAARDHDFPQP